MPESDNTPHGRLMRQIAGVIDGRTQYRPAERNQTSGYYFVPVDDGVQVFYYDLWPGGASLNRQAVFIDRLLPPLTEEFGTRRLRRQRFGNRLGFHVLFAR